MLIHVDGEPFEGSLQEAVDNSDHDEIEVISEDGTYRKLVRIYYNHSRNAHYTAWLEVEGPAIGREIHTRRILTPK